MSLVALSTVTMANTCNLKTKIFNESGNLVIADGRIIRVADNKMTARLPVKGVNFQVDVSVDISNLDLNVNSKNITQKKIAKRTYSKYGEQVIETQLNGLYKTSIIPFSEELKVESTLSCIVDIS